MARPCKPIETQSRHNTKEEIEARNNAESLVYNCQKTIEELGDKISGEEKAKAETEIANVKKALEGTDVEAIKSATEKLLYFTLLQKNYINKQREHNKRKMEQMQQKIIIVVKQITVPTKVLIQMKMATFMMQITK